MTPTNQVCPRTTRRPRPALALLAALVALAAAGPAHADEERERQLERELEEVKRRLEALERRPPSEAAPPPAPSPIPAPAPSPSPSPAPSAPAAAAAPAAPAPPAAPAAPAAPELELTPPWNRDALDTPGPLRGVYDKPFLASIWRRVFVGGYVELEYHAFEDDVLGVPRGFRAHRTNVFLFGEVADRIRFGSELEFENEEPGEDLEVAVEMAFVDWVLFEELQLRGGVILVPLGRVNVNHDGPVRELTDRPLVSTFVIPTTLSEAGVGIHGAIALGDDLTVAYETYITNGFRLLDRDGELAAPVEEREQILREGRPSLGGDNNKNVATTGRVGIEALGALTLGGSWHIGSYDERSDNLLSIVAGDGALVVGPFALEGEIAWAGFERDTFARTAGIPDRFWGFYVQASASHMPEWLRRNVPHVFDDPGAKLTVVVRYDWVDLDDDHGQALEPGLNFRPVADTVFKLAYRFGWKTLGIRDVPGRERLDDDGFVFGLASYF